MKQIQELCGKLHARIDEMSRVVKDLEKDLEHVGFYLYVEVETEDGCLSYGRHNSGDWRVFFTTKTRVCKPWQEWDRKTKVETYSHIDRLLSAAVTLLETLVDDAESSRRFDGTFVVPKAVAQFHAGGLVKHTPQPSPAELSRG